MEVVLFHIKPRPDIDTEAYQAAFERMLELVAEVPGFVSIDGFGGEDGSELAVARFESREAIDQWRDQPEHVLTRQRGRDEFFDAYDITIATVWKHYDWTRDEASPG